MERKGEKGWWRNAYCLSEIKLTDASHPTRKSAQHWQRKEERGVQICGVCQSREGVGCIYCGEYFKRMHREEELWVHYSTDIYLQNPYSCRKTFSVTSWLNSETAESVFITVQTARAFIQCSFILLLYHWHYYYYYCTIIHIRHYYNYIMILPVLWQ